MNPAACVGNVLNANQENDQLKGYTTSHLNFGEKAYVQGQQTQAHFLPVQIFANLLPNEGVLQMMQRGLLKFHSLIHQKQ